MPKSRALFRRPPNFKLLCKYLTENHWKNWFNLSDLSSAADVRQKSDKNQAEKSGAFVPVDFLTDRAAVVDDMNIDIVGVIPGKPKVEIGGSAAFVRMGDGILRAGAVIAGEIRR